MKASSPLQVFSQAFGGGIETLQATGPAGRDYVLQVSTDLSAWKDVQTTSSMPAIFSVTNLGGATQRFYRIRLGPAGPR